MHYVKQFDINGVATKQVACIELHGKPNAATEGYVGVLGIDMDSPTHEVYKCCAVNGSIYTWELLSSGLSMLVTDLVAAGAETVTFPYTGLKKPPLYLVKIGDSILDGEGYVYQVVSIGANSCVATYCGIHIVKFGMSAYGLAVQEGFEGTLEEWLESLSGVYVGSGEMPDWCHVQIDPDGEVVEIPDAANALKGTASGELVSITDTSPIEHEMGVNVRNKNLLNIDGYERVTSGGITTIEGNAITLTRLATGNPPSIIWEFGDYRDFVGKTLTVSFTLDAMVGSDTSNTTAGMYFSYGNVAKVNNTTSVTINRFTPSDVGKTIKHTFTVPVREDYGYPFSLRFYMNGNPAEGDIITISNLQLEEGTEATSYAPYIEDVSTVKVIECGKNLFDKQSVTTVPIKNGEGNGEGCVIEQLENGIKCTQVHRFQYPNNSQYFKVEGGKQYTLSANAYNTIYQPRLLIFWFDAEMNGLGDKQISWKTGDGKNSGTFTAPTNAVFAQIRINGGTLSSDNTEYSVTFTEIQFELGNQATEYEAYRGTEYAVDADGAVKGIMSNGKAITLYTDTAGAVLDCTYNKDANKVIGGLLERIAALEAAVL